MHNAFLISEVLSCIVDHLAEDTVQSRIVFAEDTDKTGRQALVVLARTCIAFSEPALDAVWRKLHSLKPFLRCLPTTKASYDDTTSDGALPPFSDEEWDVVLRYAPRVRKLTLNNDELSVKILRSLWFRTTLLLPNLRSLSWTYEDHTVVPSIRLLLSPSLVHLDMWVEDDGDYTSFLAFLESYHVLCPNLKSLGLGYSTSFLDVTAAVSRAVSRSPNLESLGCGHIDEAALIHVIQSRCLRKFSSDLVNHQPDDLRRLAAHGTPDHFPFKNLRILELHVKELSSIVPYLQAQHQPFEEVSFTFRTVATPGVFHEFFAALSSATRRRTLRRIRLFASLTVTERRTPPQIVNFRVLSLLMTLNLHVFDISIKNPISLDDNEFVQLAQAWPELEVLNLGIWDYPVFVQTPTLRGLVLLLARCPRLRNLGLSVDATNIPSLSEAELLVRNTSIRRISVANSPIQEPVTRVAHFLLERLPSLKMVVVGLSYAKRMDCYWMWKKVDEEIGRIAGRTSGPDWNVDMDM